METAKVKTRNINSEQQRKAVTDLLNQCKVSGVDQNSELQLPNGFSFGKSYSQAADKAIITSCLESQKLGTGSSRSLTLDSKSIEALCLKGCIAGQVVFTIKNQNTLLQTGVFDVALIDGKPVISGIHFGIESKTKNIFEQSMPIMNVDKLKQREGYYYQNNAAEVWEKIDGQQKKSSYSYNLSVRGLHYQYEITQEINYYRDQKTDQICKIFIPANAVVGQKFFVSFANGQIATILPFEGKTFKWEDVNINAQEKLILPK